MTENEKLRALLAEARAALSQGCWNGKCCAVRKRIDDSLAEPVQDYEALYRTNVRCECGDDDACLLARQRDAARAEVERLRLALAGAENSIAAHVEHEKRLLVESSELAQEAFQRGAEAMREAAALEIERQVDGLMRIGLMGDIRALPIPEDKP